MTEFDTMRLIYLLGALVLVSSAFRGSRIGIGQLARMVFAWIGIFVLAYLIAVNVEPVGRALGVKPATVSKDSA